MDGDSVISEIVTVLDAVEAGGRHLPVLYMNRERWGRLIKELEALAGQEYDGGAVWAGETELRPMDEDNETDADFQFPTTPEGVSYFGQN